MEGGLQDDGPGVGVDGGAGRVARPGEGGAAVVQILGGRVVWGEGARGGEEIGAGACQRDGELERGAQFGEGRIWGHFVRLFIRRR